MVSIKLFFGLSYLSVPNTFRLGGIIGGAFLLTFVVIVNLITMLQCLAVASKYPGVKSYSELGFRALGPRGKLCVDICSVVT